MLQMTGTTTQILYMTIIILYRSVLHGIFLIQGVIESSCVQLKWELGSPVLGMLLRKYAPHDVYEASIFTMPICKLGGELGKSNKFPMESVHWGLNLAALSCVKNQTMLS